MDLRICYLLGVTIVPVTLLIAVADEQPPVGQSDMGVANAAWQQRHDRVRSLRATLTQETTTHRDYFLLAPTRGGKKALAPEKDILISFGSVVTLKGDTFFKYSYTRKKWNPVSRDLESSDYTAFSNPDKRGFVEQFPGSDRHPTVSESKRAVSDENVLALVPLMLTVRSRQPYHRQLANYTPTGKPVTVEGRDCVEVRKGSRTEGQTEFMYLDSERDWVVRRIDVFIDGKLVKRITAEHKADPVAGWLPASWSYVTRSPDGNPLNSGKVTVKSVEVNADIPDDEFRPKYLAGTFVVDDTKGDWQKSTVSVVKRDGSKGVELPLGEQPSYAQLLEANASARRQRIWLYVFVTVGIAVFAAATAYWYRRRRAARNTVVAGPTG